MKILKIRFQNIHSLKGEHEIDFASGILAEAGLFAITGPTGSGKSTLLDVITLALYNRIARVDRAVTNTVLEDDGGIMTRNMTNCYAEVDYAVNGKAYRSHWSIERNRNNNLNNRKQELVDVATGSILESGTKTPDKNQEIICLSYEQFVKAMVLSQGEFSKLLQAPRNERNKLLEDITGARSYRNIGKAVFQRYAEVKKKVELKEAGLATIALLTEEDIKEKQAELTNLKISQPKVQKAYEEQRERIEIRKQFLEAKKEEETLAQKGITLQHYFTDFEGNRSQLAKHEQLAKYGPDLRNYDLTKKEHQHIEQQRQNLQKTKGEEEVRLRTHLKTIENLIRDTVTKENGNAKLESFRSTITRLQSQEIAKRDEAQLYHSQLKNLVNKVQLLDYDFNLSNTPIEFEKEVARLKGRLEEAIAASGVTSSIELDQQLDNLRTAQEQARELLDKKGQAIKFQQQLGEAKTHLIAEQGIEKETTEALLTLLKEVAVLDTQVTELKKILEHQRKHQSLEQHRTQLKDEEPCPLCGALEHPYATVAPHFDMNEERLNGKEALLKEKRERSITLQENNRFRLGEMQRIQTEIDQKTQDNSALDTHIMNLAKALKWNPKDSLEELQAQRNVLAKLMQHLLSCKQAFLVNDVLVELKEPRQSWQKALNDYNAAKAERSKRYSGSTIDTESNTLSTKLIRSIASQKNLEIQATSIQKQLLYAAQLQNEHHEKLQSILLKENLSDLEQLRLAILPEEIANNHRKRKNELESWRLLLTEKETTNSNSLKVLLGKDATELVMELLEDSFKQAKEKWEDLSVNLGKITQLLEDDEKTRKKFKNEQTALNILKKDHLLWKTMNDLIGDSYGNKFSNFVQDLTLEQLIGYANKRLSEFTDRYVLDIPTADEAEKSDTLKIFDTYMGNARRSVKTLSGGETFLVSLAMAFALSDIASRNVKIESLFIDEGFGTLDPETLDQAITILEKMQNEGDRSVGVISHVGALKERITTQVQLEKSSLGHSQIRVVQ